MRITKAALLAAIADIVAGSFATINLHLFSAFNGAPNPVPSDFTESAFSGYADVAGLTFQGDRVYPDGTVGQSFVETFNGANATPQVSENVLGWYITNGANSAVMMWDTFAEPVPMMDVDSMLNVIGEFKLDPSMTVGESVVS